MSVPYTVVGILPMKASDFMQREGLVMEVFQRRDRSYGAIFKGCGMREGSVITYASGYGKDPQAAIADYLYRIRGEMLVYGPIAADMRHIQCPAEWLPEEDA